MKDFQELYPQYNYIFLADSKNCPFGNKDGETIKNITFDGIQWLFNQGAKIVILACNTAAAYAVRSRQTQYPEKKVLSITIPGVEKILKDDTNKKIGILATQATILSNIYTDLFHKFGGKNNPDFQFVMAPKLVDLVESGENRQEEIDFVVQEHINKFRDIDTLILGCTHFPILINNIKRFFIGDIVDPSKEAAIQFGDYLERHPEIKNNLTTGGQTTYYTT
jgi:glutamate racemase